MNHSFCVGTKAGGDSGGLNLRTANYTVNLLNQYSQRDVPGAADVIGLAKATAAISMTPDSTGIYRRGEYYQKKLTIDNSSSPQYQSLSVTATLSPNSDMQTGNIFLPKTPEVFTPDTDGNLISDGRWNYTWDAENRLIRLVANTSVGPQQRLDFEYDYVGKRIRKKVWNNTAGTGTAALDRKFIYDGWNLVAVLDGNNNNALLQSFCWGNDLSGTLQGAGGVGGLLWLTDNQSGTAGTYFYSYDENGDVVTLASAVDGSLAAQYEYGPFAEMIRSTGLMAKPNPFRFSTKYQDDETDLVYYGFRYYNSRTGQSLSYDPLAESGGLNLYVFLANDSINRVDYLGLKQFNLFYDFVPTNEYSFLERLNQPFGINYVNTGQEVLENVKATVAKYDPEGKNCNCIESLTLSAHGRGPGNLPLGDILFQPNLFDFADRINRGAAQGTRLSKQQQDLVDTVSAAKAFMAELAKHPCTSGLNITFVVCDAGRGDEGKQLETELKKVFGGNVKTTLFSGPCTLRGTKAGPTP